MRGHDKTPQAAPDLERLLADARKTPLQGRADAQELLYFRARAAGALGSRAAQQIVNGCGGALGWAILTSCY